MIERMVQPLCGAKSLSPNQPSSKLCGNICSALQIDWSFYFKSMRGSLVSTSFARVRMEQQLAIFGPSDWQNEAIKATHGEMRSPSQKSLTARTYIVGNLHDLFHFKNRQQQKNEFFSGAIKLWCACENWLANRRGGGELARLLSIQWIGLLSKPGPVWNGGSIISLIYRDTFCWPQPCARYQSQVGKSALTPIRFCRRETRSAVRLRLSFSNGRLGGLEVDPRTQLTCWRSIYLETEIGISQNKLSHFKDCFFDFWIF